MSKRYRTLRAKPGELRAYWGKVDSHSGPDLCYAWGPGTDRADGRLLHNTLACDQLIFADFPSTKTTFGPSFIKELEERGYDITTLRFSVQMKSSGES